MDAPLFFLQKSTQHYKLAPIYRPKKYYDAKQTEAEIIFSNLAFTFLTSRLAHYVKRYFRESVGRNAGVETLQRGLASWLDTLVSDYPNPTETVISERPLRGYRLEELKEKESDPGFFEKVVLEIRPHVAILGSDINLSISVSV